MNSADERLRAAARTAADLFPHGGDLPPLRLTERPRGRRTRIGPAHGVPVHGPRRVQAWIAPLAAAAAVVAVISALVVPHVIASNTRHPKLAKHVPATAPALTRREQRRVDALVVQWVAFATGPQFDRGTRLIWLLHVRYGQATARCMAAAGYHISDQMGSFSLGEFGDNTQMPDLPLIGRTHEFTPMNGISGAVSYPADEQKALRACAAAGEPVMKPMLMAYSELNGAWWKIVTRAQGSKRVEAAIPALNACAARYGFPNGAYGRTYPPLKTIADLMDWIAGFIDGAGSRGASNSALRALDRHWTPIFVSCATPVVSVYQRMLLSARPGFLHQHARQLAQLDKLVYTDLVHPHS